VANEQHYIIAWLVLQLHKNSRSRPAPQGSMQS